MTRHAVPPALTAAAAPLLLLALVPGLLGPGGPGGETPSGGSRKERPAPEFPTLDAAQWINSAPTRMADLRGQVVLLHVWTFG